MSALPKPDRRIERTREALRRALIGLLADRPWDEIAVQDICDRAGIGRSTFYLHHPHKEALLEAGLDGLRAYLGSTRDDAPLGFMGGLVAHVDEQRQVFRSIIGRRGGQAVQRLFREMIEHLVRDDLAGRGYPSTDLAFRTRFVAGGIVDALALWIDTPHSQSAGEMVAFLRAAGNGAAAG